MCVWHLTDTELRLAAGLPLDAAVAEVAAGRDWVLSTAQLLALGLTHNHISTRLARRQLSDLGRGVYGVGPDAPAMRGRIRAGLLRAGAGSAAACRSAGALHGIRPYDGAWVDVTRPGRSSVRDTLRITGRVLEPEDLTEIDGLPVTALGLTLIDNAAAAPGQVAAMLRAAEIRRLDLFALEEAIARRPGRPGVAAVRRGLEAHHPLAARTRSVDELVYLMLVEAAGLPMPAVNVVVDGFELDMHWADLRLNVEIDGAQHRNASHRARDRRRDEALRARGWHVRRFTTEGLRERPAWVVAETVAELRRASARHAA